MAERYKQREQELAATEGAMHELQEALGLSRLPNRIECFDISHTQGAEAVASMVVFEGGRPKKEDYRRFKIRVDKNNDFANMAEAVSRRFKRGLLERAAISDGRVKDLEEGVVAAEEEALYQSEMGFSAEEEAAPETAPIEELPEAAPAPGETPKFAVFPDLLIIDGGKGQLSYARDAMRALGVEHIATFGLAKEEELLCQEGREEWIRLPRGSQGLFLLQRVRDEAHRFAVTYHRKLHRKAATHSRLDDVPGIGPKRKKALLKEFGSLRRIREATVEQLLAVPGMNRETAERVLEHLGGTVE